MDTLLEALGPGFHCYSPFSSNSVADERSRHCVINLSELCKHRILRSVTLLRLSAAVEQLPLPRRLSGYVADLSTADDFEKIECAPFSSDVFCLNFLHRALTYRVTCTRDGREYMATYGYGPTEELTLGVEHRGWASLQHPNVLCVRAAARDPHTDNVFYVYQRPRLSLDQMGSAFSDQDRPLPDAFFWRLTSDLCEALKVILDRGLRYGRFWLDNIFVVEERFVLENGLMRKGVKYASKEKCGGDEEAGVLCDVVSVLRHLVPNSDHSESLLKFIQEVENESSIDAVIGLVRDSAERDVDSFSFSKLIQSLKV